MRKIIINFLAERVNSRDPPLSFLLPALGSLDLRIETDSAGTLQSEKLGKKNSQELQKGGFLSGLRVSRDFSSCQYPYLGTLQWGPRCDLSTPVLTYSFNFVSSLHSEPLFLLFLGYLSIPHMDRGGSLAIIVFFSQAGSLCSIMDWYIFTQQDLTGLLRGQMQHYIENTRFCSKY